MNYQLDLTYNIQLTFLICPHYHWNKKYLTLISEANCKKSQTIQKNNSIYQDERRFLQFHQINSILLFDIDESIIHLPILHILSNISDRSHSAVSIWFSTIDRDFGSRSHSLLNHFSWFQSDSIKRFNEIQTIKPIINAQTNEHYQRKGLIHLILIQSIIIIHLSFLVFCSLMNFQRERIRCLYLTDTTD